MLKFVLFPNLNLTDANVLFLLYHQALVQYKDKIHFCSSSKRHAQVYIQKLDISCEISKNLGLRLSK